MKNSVLRRPKSVHEVAAESMTYGDFGYNLKDFLHEVAEASKKGASLEPMFAQEPPRLAERFAEGLICDAFLAAMTDFFCRKNHIVPPEWALKEERVLDQPWFSPNLPTLRALLLRDSPSAFKDKNIFIFDNALNVA